MSQPEYIDITKLLPRLAKVVDEGVYYVKTDETIAPCVFSTHARSNVKWIYTTPSRPYETTTVSELMGTNRPSGETVFTIRGSKLIFREKFSVSSSELSNALVDMFYSKQHNCIPNPKAKPNPNVSASPVGFVIINRGACGQAPLDIVYENEELASAAASKISESYQGSDVWVAELKHAFKAVEIATYKVTQHTDIGE